MTIRAQLEELMNQGFLPDVLPEDTLESQTNDSQRHEISTLSAYLIGVPDTQLKTRPDIFDQAQLTKLEKNRSARIVRNLCMVRTAMFRHNSRIYAQMTQENKGLYSIPEIPYKALKSLAEDGLDIVKSGKYSKNNYVKDINALISDRINNCRALYPQWIPWAYIRSIFVMPGGDSESGIKAEGDKYLADRSSYPYECYVNGFPEAKGNILASDKAFVSELYLWNGDELSDKSKVQDINSTAQKNIRRFFEQACSIDIIVDCENSDPYRMCGCLKTLNEESGNKVRKIILVNDSHTSSAWEFIKEHTDIPITEILVERVVEHKSLVDVKLTAETCREFYQNQVDSFILLSSDSDFWALISSIPDASFIVMMEEEKCGQSIRDKLLKENYYYCFLNDFYSGDQQDIMNLAVTKNFVREVNDIVSVNVRDLFEKAWTQARASMRDDQKEALYKKLSKRLSFEITEDGELKLYLK